MPSSARVWLRQAGSDLLAARYLAQQDTDDFYCQTAAKCQQVVEKSVKAIAVELTERRLVTLTIGFDHRIDQYIEAIIRAPRRSAMQRSMPDYIVRMLRRNRN
jgi:HEPN domain-containing protein